MTLDLTNSAGWTANSRDLCVFPSQLWDYRYLLPFPDFHTCAGDRAQVLMLTRAYTANTTHSVISPALKSSFFLGVFLE